MADFMKIACVVLLALAATEPSGATGVPGDAGSVRIAGKVTLDALLDVTSEDGRLLISQGPRQLDWSSNTDVYVRVPGAKLGGKGEALLRIDVSDGQLERVGQFKLVSIAPDGKHTLIFDDGELWVGEVRKVGYRKIRKIRGWQPYYDGNPDGAKFAWSADSGSLAYVASADSAPASNAKSGEHSSEVVLKLLELGTLDDRVLYGPRKSIPAVTWPSGRPEIYVSIDAGGADRASSIVAVPLKGNPRVVISDPSLPARMLLPTASPDGKRLAYFTGQYFHDPVAFALPIQAMDIATGEIEPMVQPPGIETRSIRWGGKSDLWGACRTGPLLDSLCRLDQQGRVDSRLAGPDMEEIKTFKVSPSGDRLVWTSLDTLGVFRVRTQAIGEDSSKILYRSSAVVDESRMERISPFSWETRDGFELKGLLVLPANAGAGGKYPLVVDVHGSSPVLLRGALFSSTPLEWQMWADMGYAVFVADYRESGSYGLSDYFLRSSSDKFIVDRNVDDVIDGVEKIKSLGLVLDGRIAVIGHSMGSFAANQMLLRGERFAAVVSKEGSTSWNLNGLYDHMKVAWKWWFNTEDETKLKRMMSDNSLELHTDRVESPVLFINAVDEARSPTSLSKKDSIDRVVSDLKKQGKEADVVHLEDELHVPVKMANVRKFGRIVVDWIQGKLQ
jgi:dipeptidyl aminopeptidase/acylaminoacyl peptidase